MNRNIEADLLELFVNQVGPELATIRAGLDAFRDYHTDGSSLHELRGIAHRIKGEASVIGLTDFSHMAYHHEELLDELGSSGDHHSPALPTLFSIQLGLENWLDGLLKEHDDTRAPLWDAFLVYRRYRGLPESGDQAAFDRLVGPPLTTSHGLEDVDRAHRASFQQEVSDNLQIILDRLSNLDRLDLDSIIGIRRAVHSIKGGASAIGLAHVADLAHAVEDALESLAQHELPLSTGLRDAIISALDVIAHVVEENATDSDTSAFVARIRQEVAASTAGFELASVAPSYADAKEALSEQRGDVLEEICRDLARTVPTELHDVYRMEAEDHLKTIYQSLNALQTANHDLGELQNVRRSAHTLKGASGAVGFTVVTKLSHRMEDLLDWLYEHPNHVDREVLSLLLTTTDRLHDLSFNEFESDAIAVNIVELYQAYDELLARYGVRTSDTAVVELNVETAPAMPEESPAEAPRRNTTANSEATSKEPGQMLRVPLEKIDDLVSTVGELIINRTTIEQRMGDFVRHVDEMYAVLARLRTVAAEMETRHSVDALKSDGGLFGGRRRAPLERRATPQSHFRNTLISEFDALEFDRYSEFHLLTRSVGEVTNDVNTVSNELRALIGDFDTLLARQDRLSRNTQDRLMRIRMVPLATLATRLHRAARVVATSQQKQVELIIDGEDTELDKTVLEEIADPFLHLIRNAVDHGVEPPDVRIIKGKPEKATIRIRAFYQGTQVVIRISDDGAGLDPARIMAAAIRKGHIGEAEADKLTPQEVFPYIFLPGLSTATQVSEVSGRGVGMDIVRDKVQKLKGTIHVESEPNRGTTFTIRLPLTLAVTRSLMVMAGNEMYAIPMQSVLQITRISRDDIEQMGTEPVIRLNGTACPLFKLAAHLGIHESDDDSVAVPVLILRSGDRCIAVQVDRIIAGRDVVVKSLGSHLRRVPGLIGATLLGDGTVVPILDANALVASDGQLPAVAAPSRHRVLSDAAMVVMIVDDSVSVRRVMENLIRSQGWTPIVAKDGVDALEILQTAERTPDIVLLDVEMPRMDGYELLSTLRSSEATKETPVVMVTSRAGEKHRDKAFALGATAYLVKPYQDEQLLSLVRKLTAVQQESVTA